MPLISKILFPVDFSPSCVAMAPYVKRAAAITGAEVSLIHVFDPASRNAFEIYVRPPEQIAEEHQSIAREKLDRFLVTELPRSDHRRILVEGDPATRIAEVANDGFDLIVMPTHAGTFRRMLLGSTTARVLNDSERPVLTSCHAETIAPRPLDHRRLLCAISLDPDSERVLRFTRRAAAELDSSFSILHAIQANDDRSQVQLDLEEQLYAPERKKARLRIAEMQKNVGSAVPVEIVLGSVKDALLEGVRQFDADVLVIGRSPHSGSGGRLRDLTYAIVRDSPFPVLSV